MSDQLQALATSTPEKEPRDPLNRRPGWVPGPGYMCFPEEKNLFSLTDIGTQFIGCPARSLVTMLTSYHGFLQSVLHNEKHHVKAYLYALSVFNTNSYFIKKFQLAILCFIKFYYLVCFKNHLSTSLSYARSGFIIPVRNKCNPKNIHFY